MMVMNPSTSAVVLGAGVSGLTTAIRLQETGWHVRIVSEHLPQDTTSAVAAAIWLPYKAYPPEHTLRWGTRTFTVFEELAKDSASGVSMQEGFELWRQPMPDPWWRGAVPQFARARTAELPPGYCDGFCFTVPRIEMPIYLSYLMERFLASGGHCEQRAVRSLDEAAAIVPVLVNCTGLGARSLVPDESLQPIRGQIVRVANPGLTRFFLDEEGPDGMTYIVPRSRDCILGGTADEGCWERSPDAGVAAAILARCVALEPRLAGAAVLEHKVGLRPGRPAVRLEWEERPGGVVCVHNYGHGGSGVTLSWGCAEEAVALLRRDF
jgi:D-amino-acid oxidase